MADSTPAFTKLVPGFDFLQGLVKNAGSALPGIGQWVAPTLNPEELEKRIEELRTVQFWLEQNARMLGATIQALEVQRMTLSTLKAMNVQMSELRDSMKLPVPATAGGAAAPAGVVDPMQWWGALTQQFTRLAAEAMKDNATEQTLKKTATAPIKAASALAKAARGERKSSSSAPRKAPR